MLYQRWPHPNPPSASGGMSTVSRGWCVAVGGRADEGRNVLGVQRRT